MSERKLPICGTCKKPYDRKGGIMITMCQECIDNPPAKQPEPYVNRNGLFIVNLETKKSMPVPEPELLFEADLTETLGIRKFIEMSLADLNDQVTKASKDCSIPAKQFDLIKFNAMIVTAWLTSALQTVDGMLAEAKARSNESIYFQSEQKKVYTGC
jgi:hypothetical protein